MQLVKKTVANNSSQAVDKIVRKADAGRSFRLLVHLYVCKYAVEQERASIVREWLCVDILGIVDKEQIAHRSVIRCSDNYPFECTYMYVY